MKIKQLLVVFLSVFLFSGCMSEKETTGSCKLFKSKKVEIVEISTNFGNMYIWLYDQTPLHKENFLKLAKEGFYDGCTFHRIIDNFMIQGGDPNTKAENPQNVGNGGPGYTIPAEFRPNIKHKYGSVAAARMGDMVNPKKESSGSQFYIVENKNGTPHLDGAYTVFGEVIKGFETIDKIAEQPKDMRDKPLNDIKMTVKVLEIKPKKLQEEYNFTIPE